MRSVPWSVAVAVLLASACSFSGKTAGTGDGGVTPRVGFLADTSLQDERSGAVVVPLTMSPAADAPVTVSFTVADGSAQVGSDYTAAETNGTITFAPGETEKGIPLEIIADMVDEESETIQLSLSAPMGAELGIDSHTITISANILPRASITQATSSAMENASATVGVFLDPVSPVDVTIEYAIGGQVNANDYTNTNGSFVVPANTANFELPVAIVDDMIDEFDEELELTLTGSPDVIITNARTRKHTIGDNDAEPNVGFASATATVSETGTSVTLEIALSRESGKPIEVTISSTTGTNASLSKDYTYLAQTLSIPAGSTTVMAQVDVVNDMLDEINEVLVTRIDSATNAIEETGGIRQNTLTITDDDPEPTISFACGGSTREPLVATTTTVAFKLVLSAPSGKTVSVTLNPDEGGNNADEGTGQDYIIPTKTFMIAPETAEQSFDVTILGDTSNDTPEDIVIDLSGLQNATAGNPASCIHTITAP